VQRKTALAVLAISLVLVEYVVSRMGSVPENRFYQAGILGKKKT
jgi:hypothetical protein